MKEDLKINKEESDGASTDDENGEEEICVTRLTYSKVTLKV